jgi:5-methyltetrahydrofolate--homocysteine methyltransferase
MGGRHLIYIMMHGESLMTLLIIRDCNPKQSLDCGVQIVSVMILKRILIHLSFCRHSVFSDFIAPKASGHKDYLGAFAVTAGFEIEEYAKSFRDKDDDYTAIIIQALADRFAESLAEYMHKMVRDQLGFGKKEPFKFGERFSAGIEDMHPNVEWLMKERYRSIRPAAGYPSSPDHSEKEALWKLLEAEKHTGIQLTTSFAMNPPSSVSGLYFMHPEATYFAVGKIQQDQVIDYANRKGISIEEAEKWLQPNLAYSI